MEVCCSGQREHFKERHRSRLGALRKTKPSGIRRFYQSFIGLCWSGERVAGKEVCGTIRVETRAMTVFCMILRYLEFFL